LGEGGPLRNGAALARSSSTAPRPQSPFSQSVGQGSARLALDSTAAADAIASDEIREII